MAAEVNFCDQESKNKNIPSSTLSAVELESWQKQKISTKTLGIRRFLRL
jgi:hypothetical protein